MVTQISIVVLKKTHYAQYEDQKQKKTTTIAKAITEDRAIAIVWKSHSDPFESS